MLADALSIFIRMMPHRFTGEMRACELCGGADHDIVGRRDRYGHRLRTVLCRGCGLVFTNPMPTAAELDLFYRKHYRASYQNTDTPRTKSAYKAFKGARGLHDAIKDLIPSGGLVVDVGSGGGEFLSLLRANGVDALGIEPFEPFANYARERYGVRVLTAGWQDAPIAPQSVDFVVANHVLEHFRHPPEALARFRTWLKPQGFLYLSVPQIESPQRTPYGRFHFSHLYNFNHDSLVMMALKAGFEPEPTLYNRSTNVVFRVGTHPAANWMTCPDNYRRMAAFFREHTNRRHFLSAAPYVRWVRRMWKLGSAMVVAPIAMGSRRRPAKDPPTAS